MRKETAMRSWLLILLQRPTLITRILEVVLCSLDSRWVAAPGQRSSVTRPRAAVINAGARCCTLTCKNRKGLEAG